MVYHFHVGRNRSIGMAAVALAAGVGAALVACAPVSERAAEAINPLDAAWTFDAPPADAARAPLDASAADVDLAPDAAPLPDAAAPLPDAAAPLPDAAAPLPDAAAPLPDAAAPLPDAALSPTRVQPAPLADLTVTTLRAGPVTGVYAGPTGATYAVVGRRLWRWVPAAAEPTDLGPCAPLLSATTLADGTVVLATLEGVRSVRDDVLGTPPLADAVADRFVVGLATTLDVLFLSTDAGLLAWRGGALYALGFGPSEESPEYASLAPAADGLWIARNDALTWLAPDSGAPNAAWRAWPVDTGGWHIDALAATTDGTLWALDAGELRALDVDGRQAWFALPEPVLGVSAAPDAPDLWLRTDAGLWRSAGGLFVPFNAPAALSGLAAASEGRVLLAWADTVGVGVPGRGFSLDAPRSPLAEDAVVEVRPATPERVTQVIAQLDALPAEDVVGPPWRVTLDVEALGDGPHTLTLTTRWADAPDATARFDFRVALPPPPPPPPTTPPPPTWSQDIEPLFTTHCAQCHGPRGFAHPIDGAAGLESEYDAVFAAVRERRMPLPPNRALTAAELALLTGWAAAGFPE